MSTTVGRPPALSTPPPPPDELLDQAQTALHEGRPEAAVALCRQVLDLQPGHPEALLVQAEAHRDLDDGDAAVLCYRRLLVSQPEHAVAWAGMGMALFDQGRVVEASRSFTRAIRARRDLGAAYHGRALVRERAGDMAGAARDHQRAWKLASVFPLPVPLDDDAVTALLLAALEDASDEVRAWVSSAAVRVEDVPELAACAGYEPFAPPGELLGHVPIEDEGDHRPTLAPTLILYRCNLSRFAHDTQTLVDSLREGLSAQVEAWFARTAIDE